MDKRDDSQVGVPVWTPIIALDKATLPVDASIRDFQQRKAGYVANAVEQALLLLEDMTDLRLIRKYEVFLSLKRVLALVSPSTVPSILYIYIYIYFFILILILAFSNLRTFSFLERLSKLRTEPRK